MPSKYVVHTKPTPHRFEAITKSGIIAWEEGCLKCAVCVKKQCIYGVYDNRGLNARQISDELKIPIGEVELILSLKENEGN